MKRIVLDFSRPWVAELARLERELTPEHDITHRTPVCEVDSRELRPVVRETTPRWPWGWPRP